MLAGGDVHRLSAKVNLNVFQDVHGLDQEYKSGMVQLVIGCQGLATHVINVGEGPYNAITLAPGKVSIIHSRQWHLEPMKEPAGRFDPIYQGRGNVLYNAPITSVNTINETDVGLTAGVQLA